MSKADIMAFGAHPDDVEIGCGGTLLKLIDAGYSAVVVDLVRGEMGTRGSVETRAAESARSSEILGITARENLALEDGQIRMSKEGRRRVADVVRKWKPEIVFLPYWQDRHPDHANASQLIYDGVFLAGLAKFSPDQESHRPSRLMYYMEWTEFDPTFIVDITDQAERKMQAIYAYDTQFNPDATRDPQTPLTSPTTDWLLRSRMMHYGALIRKRYGEGFLIRGRLEVEDPMTLKYFTF